MTDFALYHTAQWRDGEMPNPKGATHIVRKDTRHHAYDVPTGEFDSFLSWVAATFSGDNDPLFGVDFEGTVEDYLEEIDVSIHGT